MNLLSLIITLAIAGFGCWLALKIPMPNEFKHVMVGVIILCLIIFILQQFGFHTGLPTITLK